MITPGPHGPNCKCVPLDFSSLLCVLRNWSAVDPADQERAACYLAAIVPLLLLVPILLMHAYFALTTECGVSFQRGGAMLAMIVALAFGGIEFCRDRRANVGTNPPQLFDLRNPFFVLPLLAAVATFVWGYGDLFFPMTGCCDG